MFFIIMSEWGIIIFTINNKIEPFVIPPEAGASLKPNFHFLFSLIYLMFIEYCLWFVNLKQ